MTSVQLYKNLKVYNGIGDVISNILYLLQMVQKEVVHGYLIVRREIEFRSAKTRF